MRRNMDLGILNLRRAWRADPSDANAAAAFLSAATRAGWTQRAILHEILEVAPAPVAYAPEGFLDAVRGATIDTAAGITEEQRERLLRQASMEAFEHRIETFLVHEAPHAVAEAVARNDLAGVTTDFEQGPGLYLHGWVDRRIERQMSSAIYDWRKALSAADLDRFAVALRSELDERRNRSRNTTSELARLEKDIATLEDTEDLEARRRWFEALIGLYTPSPYNIDFTVLAEDLGHTITRPSLAITTIRGRFLDRNVFHQNSTTLNWMRQITNRWIDSFGGDAVYRLEWCRFGYLENLFLATIGLHGSFYSTGWSGLPRFCVWDPRAVRIIQPARRIGDRIVADTSLPAFMNPNPEPGEDVDFFI